MLSCKKTLLIPFVSLPSPEFVVRSTQNRTRSTTHIVSYTGSNTTLVVITLYASLSLSLFLLLTEAILFWWEQRCYGYRISLVPVTSGWVALLIELGAGLLPPRLVAPHFPIRLATARHAVCPLCHLHGTGLCIAADVQLSAISLYYWSRESVALVWRTRWRIITIIAHFILSTTIWKGAQITVCYQFNPFNCIART